ncbi:hypothetical protein SAMN05660991_02474 [Trujillonella endophytica]|uniref:Uncharacterized protein n=2 Tax=Trujillonella endophytica TaxID=673521 RepID=A0A1H8TVD2_9ACTN|nr:hypothetical protein SAMN05660991_02474 [Trujillella endophytica]
MQRGRSGRSLSERAARSGVPAPDEDWDAPFPRAAPAQAGHADQPAAPAPPPDVRDLPPPPPVVRRADGRGRHCWVHDPPGAPGVWPGLLVEWRQTDEGWHGRVAFTVAGRAGSVLMEAWLPAASLEQR